MKLKAIMSTPFYFKQFTVQQNKTAMKVGTDGVLLGAWCSVDQNPETILDVGAGTGLIALQLAQRTDAFTIDGVEVDADAYAQCVENFEQSDWCDRLFCYHSPFIDFAEEMSQEDELYDLIVSNPPFYTDEHESKNLSRNKARSASSLPFSDLLKGVVKLLSLSGVFSVILPFKEEESFIQLAAKNQLYLTRRCRVKGTPTSDVKRSLLEFSKEKNNHQVKEEKLTIEKERHQYTKEYISLVKDFYLKME